MLYGQYVKIITFSIFVNTVDIAGSMFEYFVLVLHSRVLKMLKYS